jgi:CxxC motif-containing protein (DUF1111 family)
VTSTSWFQPQRVAAILVASGLAGCVTTGDYGSPTPDPPDPGVRVGTAGAGGVLPGLGTATDPTQKALFDLFGRGMRKFVQQDKVDKDGLGPTFNLDSCGGCHLYPAIGGTSPGPTADAPHTLNPQYEFWQRNLQATNELPSFVAGDDPAHPGVTPVREARFVKDENDSSVTDGGVHDLFTIVGLPGTPASCTDRLLKQPDFKKAIAARNVIFRIPTPTFGAGLIENIPDSVIEANRESEVKVKAAFGIRGKSNVTLAGRTASGKGRIITGTENRSGNDGTIARFGWKAQNKSLLVFAGEAYNVEMGISNELFPTERNEIPECQTIATPNDHTNVTATDPLEVLSDVEKFAAFMRLLAPPQPSPNVPGGAASIANGSQVFERIGCALCHTPELVTGPSDIPQFNRQNVRLYSDLLLHNMGPNLADGISQGQAGPDEFRTAPLWGLGQRTYFLHDGRTNDLVRAIHEHESGFWPAASEANHVIRRFKVLPTTDKLDLLNFLRSL